MTAPIAPDDPRLARVGYARLVSTRGGAIDAVLKKTNVTLGRQSKKVGEADIVLGDSPHLSRTHATIRWVPASESWELAVLGKNGVTVNGALHSPRDDGAAPPPGSGVRLASGDVLLFGLHGDGLELEFLLPKAGTPMLRGGGVKHEGEGE